MVGEAPPAAHAAPWGPLSPTVGRHAEANPQSDSSKQFQVLYLARSMAQGYVMCCWWLGLLTVGGWRNTGSTGTWAGIQLLQTPGRFPWAAQGSQGTGAGHRPP